MGSLRLSDIELVRELRRPSSDSDYRCGWMRERSRHQPTLELHPTYAVEWETLHTGTSATVTDLPHSMASLAFQGLAGSTVK